MHINQPTFTNYWAGYSEHYIYNAIWTSGSDYARGRGHGLAGVEGGGLFPGHREGIPRTVLRATLGAHRALDTLPTRQHREGHYTPGTRVIIWSGVGEADRVKGIC